MQTEAWGILELIKKEKEPKLNHIDLNLHNCFAFSFLCFEQISIDSELLYFKVFLM